MKLIYCPSCKDIFNLRYEPKSCGCGKSGGNYKEDGLHAVIWGDAVPLGITNQSFQRAMKQRPKDGLGAGIVAFVIPYLCDTIEVLVGDDAPCTSCLPEPVAT